MNHPIRTITGRRYLRIYNWLLFFVLLGSSCTPAVTPIAPEPSLTRKPNTPTSTVTLTPTSTLEPTPIPSPTQTPTPDWGSIPDEQLLELAPNLPGYSKETNIETGVVAHDSGRYVVYTDNRETLESGEANPNFGRVRWVWNTEIQAFESAGRTSHTEIVNEQEISFSVLVVTSQEYEELFGNHIEIHADKEGDLSRQFLASAAIEWTYQRTGRRLGFATSNMTPAQKDALVLAVIYGGDVAGVHYDSYLAHIAEGNNVTLQTNSVNGRGLVIKVEYDPDISPVDTYNLMEDSVVHRNSPHGEMVEILKTPQDLVETHGFLSAEGVFVYKYFQNGPLCNVVNTFISDEGLSGKLCNPSQSVIHGIMVYSDGPGGRGDYLNHVCGAFSSNFLNPGGYDLPVLTSDYPALHGAWFGADCVRNP